MGYPREELGRQLARVGHEAHVTRLVREAPHGVLQPGPIVGAHDADGHGAPGSQAPHLGLERDHRHYSSAGNPSAWRSAARRNCDSDHERPPVKPPSTTRAWPLTKVASSLASHSTACAMSSGSPERLIGWTFCKMPFICGTSASACSADMPSPLPKIGVAIAPGQMQFTRMLCSPSSIATVLVSWMTAALAAL